MTGYFDALKLLKIKLSEVLSPISESALSDLSYGLHALKEALTDAEIPPGRRGVLEELRNKAEKAESTHDPEVINQLMQALSAFLSEELQEFAAKPAEGEGETMTDDERALLKAKPSEEKPDEDGAPVVEPEGAEDEEHNEESGKFVTCDACGHKQAMQEMGAATGPLGMMASGDGHEEAQEGIGGYSGVGGQPTQSRPPIHGAPSQTAVGIKGGGSLGRAPAGGGMPGRTGVASYSRTAPPKAVTKYSKQSDIPAAAHMESESMREAAPVKGGRGMEQQKEAVREAATAMTESERTELATLRAEKRDREILAKAATVIKEAGVALKPEELAPFAEAQWPVIINLAPAPARGAAQVSVFDDAGMSREAPPNMSPVEVFQASFDS